MNKEIFEQNMTPEAEQTPVMTSDADFDAELMALLGGGTLRRFLLGRGRALLLFGSGPGSSLGFGLGFGLGIRHGFFHIVQEAQIEIQTQIQVVKGNLLGRFLGHIKVKVEIFIFHGVHLPY